jgi:hypothetical protein
VSNVWTEAQPRERPARTVSLAAARAPLADAAAARIRRLGVALVVAAVAVQSVLHGVGAAFLGGDVELLDANEEATPATWASTAAVFAAALAVALLAVVRAQRRWLYGGLAALLAFLSLDDVAQLHERLNRFGEAWTVYAVPLLGLTLILLWQVAQDASSGDRRLIRIGLALLVLAVVMETLQRLWLDGYDEDSWVWALDTGIEEASELAGWGLVATALLAVMAGVYGRLGAESSQLLEPRDTLR